MNEPQAASPRAETPRANTISALAQVIRRVDGNHDKGAGALAEAIVEDWGVRYGGGLVTDASLSRLIANAVAAAVREERERLAKPPLDDWLNQYVVEGQCDEPWAGDMDVVHLGAWLAEAYDDWSTPDAL